MTGDRASVDAVQAALTRLVDSGIEVHETHISWVFLAGDRAYKLKKPVVLDFVDYGTASRRRQMCREEVRLNRRLAPDVYLGVRGVAATGEGFELTREDDPRAIDYVVEMRRYDERQTLATSLSQGTLSPEDLEAVGRRLAAFHSNARVVVADAAVLKEERLFERNLHELLQCLDQPRDTDRVLALERFAHAFIAARGEELQARARRGLVREGHGDLRAEHVLINGGVRIVDCVEFDPELRELDVADDLAFLVFDLVARHGERFGDALVNAYRDAGGDPGDDSLIAYYAAYRALVRAKVAFIRAAQHRTGSDQHRAARDEGRSLIGVAEHFAWRARLPLVLVVCGVPASGKSYLARALAQASGLRQLSSDLTRKRLARLPATDHAPITSYSANWNARTYTELGRRAADTVGENGGAIVDATFRHLADREAFDLAFGAAAPLIFVECQAPRSVLCERAVSREHDPKRVSDADHLVVAREQASWEPLDEISGGRHLILRTDRASDDMAGDVLALLDLRLRRSA